MELKTAKQMNKTNSINTQVIPERYRKQKHGCQREGEVDAVRKGLERPGEDI